ncbi:MAG: hypothetical protein IKY16_08880, partial [Bacteroidales bacterium]|nr:hypothetical protein [Bacteroidales bacterium]
GAGWDFLMQSGRELMHRNGLSLPVLVYICEAHQKKRSVCSGAYFVVEKMYLPGGGIVLRRKRVGILLCVQMSGDMVSASNQKGNVVNAITGYYCRLMTP